MSLTRRVAARVAQGLDDRFALAGTARKQTSHVFPKHHSFFWGELALYSFVVLVLTGTFLALFFVPDTATVVYSGPYEPAQGLHMSRAYESALQLTFEVRGGLFIRQIHHWSALLFVASMVLHMLRNFFTGAFRRPRELTWLGGVAMLALGIFEGYTGYSQLDDLLSGMGVRIFSGLLLSVPVVGTWLHWAVFGGEFDGQVWISRFFTLHVLVVPGLLIALIAVHLGLVWYQKHTHFPGPGATETNVVGERAAPGFGTRTAANGVCVAGVTVLLGGLFQINPIHLWGPYSPTASSIGVQPDWYAGFLIGGLRLFPRWDIHLGIYTINAPFWMGIALPLLLFGLLAAYPWIERWVTGDRRHHQLLERPRDNAGRTAVGAMALTFYLVLFVSGASDIIAIALDVPFEVLVWGGRIALIVLPPIAYLLTRRFCLGLQRADRDALERGVRTGLFEPRPDGTYVEWRQPPGGVDHAGRPVPLRYGGARVDRTVATPLPSEGEHPDQDRDDR